MNHMVMEISQAVQFPSTPLILPPLPQTLLDLIYRAVQPLWAEQTEVPLPDYAMMIQNRSLGSA